ncbi:MAG: hypothetical protein KatS3mg014_0150 [Actinomycetota bacterium]|nr:MAG: hypothetical protein KatS3mg014_0150 [Actinomycetota bacterium]
MVAALLVLGTVAVAAAWGRAVRRGASVWRTLAPLLVALGALALATGRVRGAAGVEEGWAIGVGLVGGLGSYAATRVILGLVGPRWPALAAHARAAYARGAALPRWVAVVVSAALVAPGEELFFRGLLLPELERALGRGVGAATLAWVVAVVANAPSGNVAIVAAAAVGGALWVALAVWSGGVLTPIVCHALWTGLMLAAPPPVPEAGAGGAS